MNYLLDKKSKRKKTITILISVFLLLVLFYFRSGIFSKLSYITHATFKPVLVIGNKFESITSYFKSKSSLDALNETLRKELEEGNARVVNYDAILAENDSLKEILGRKNEAADLLLSAILSKPNQSPYDTLIIDVGLSEGVTDGDTVFAFGNIPIGHIREAYEHSSKVVLFSSVGEKTQVFAGAKDTFLELVGRNGGNFEIAIPRDFVLKSGDEVVLPGITPYVVATVETIISDPRDSFQKVLLKSPVNVFELKFVEVRI